MPNVFSRDDKRLVRLIKASYRRLVCIVIFSGLHIVYVVFPDYINNFTKLGTVSFQLAFTSVIAITGIFTFPIREHLAPFKQENDPKGGDPANHVVNKANDGVGRFCDRLKEELNRDLTRLLLGVIFAVILVPATSCIFTNVLNIDPTSSTNQKRLDEDEKSNPSILFFLWTGLSAPIAEELLFRQLFIGTFFSLVIGCNYVASCRMVLRVKWLMLGGLVLLSGLLFGLYHEPSFNGVMMYYAIVGVILSLAYVIGRRNFFSSLIPHCIINIMNVLSA